MQSTSLTLANVTPQLDKNVTPQGEWKLSDRWAWAYGLPVSGIARAVAGSIAYHANDKTGLSWPGMGKIAEETGFGRTAIIAAIKVLERGGHVTVRRFKVGKMNTSNRYQLPPMGDVQDALPSAPDGLGGSASDGPELVRTELVSTTPPLAEVGTTLPDNLTVIAGGHGLKCLRCDHEWPRAKGLSHICVGRREQPSRPKQTRKGRSTSMTDRYGADYLARKRREKAAGMRAGVT